MVAAVSPMVAKMCQKFFMVGRVPLFLGSLQAFSRVFDDLLITLGFGCPSRLGLLSSELGVWYSI